MLKQATVKNYIAGLRGSTPDTKGDMGSPRFKGHEIFGKVISSISVHVVYFFGSLKKSSDYFFHNKPMLEDVARFGTGGMIGAEDHHIFPPFHLAALPIPMFLPEPGLADFFSGCRKTRTVREGSDNIGPMFFREFFPKFSQPHLQFSFGRMFRAFFHFDILQGNYTANRRDKQPC
jgi:hypothetical protein